MRNYPAALLLILAQAAHSQAVLIDHPFAAGTARFGAPQGFVGDHFVLGSRGEVWVIDSLSTWVGAADVHGTVKLFGGIEAELPAAEPAQPDCACHYPTVIKSGAAGTDIRVSAAAPGVWRVDFQDLKWSVPGGVPIQFGVSGAGRNTAAPTTSLHALRLFDENGRPLGRYTLDGKSPDPTLGLDIQVRGHRTVPVVFRSSGAMLEVSLQAGNGFEPGDADPGSLHLGARRVPPVRITEAGKALLLHFQREEIAPRPGELSVCLSGTLRGGIPFEGCDRLPDR